MTSESMGDRYIKYMEILIIFHKKNQVQQLVRENKIGLR